MMRGKPGYEHLNEPLHILVEAELPVEIIDARLMQAREILEDLLKPVVTIFLLPITTLLMHGLFTSLPLSFCAGWISGFLQETAAKRACNDQWYT